MVFVNMEIVEQQLAILSQVTGQALTFHRPQVRGEGLRSGRDRRVGIEITR